MSNGEEQLYPEIQKWLEQYLSDKYCGYKITTTYDTSRRYLDVVLKEQGINCKESVGLNIKVDIVGILKRGDNYKLVFVEVKDKDLNLKDLGQLWGYTQLINPMESYLISSTGLGTLSPLFNVLNREDLLRYGINEDNFMRVAKWDSDRKSIDYSTIVPKI